MRSNTFEEPNKKHPCCLILIIFGIILMIILGISFSKFHDKVTSLLGFLNKNQTQDNGHVNIANSFNIPGSLYFVKDNNLWKASGSDITQVTTSGNVSQASVSSDNTKVIYSTINDNYSDLYLLNLSSTTTSQLTKNQNARSLYSNLWSLDPSFSPNGNNIVFISDKAKFTTNGSDLSIYQMPLTAKTATQLTHALPYTGGDQDPSYYPLNSNYVLYEKYIYVEGQPQPYSKLYVMDIMNKQGYPITPDFSGDLQAAFSPDGKYIAFIERTTVDGVPDKYTNLYIMPFDLTNIDKTDPTTAFYQAYQNKVLVHQGLDAMPVFSSDGKQIAFITSQQSDFNLATISISQTVDKQGNIIITPKDFKLITQNSHISAVSKLSWTQ